MQFQRDVAAEMDESSIVNEVPKGQEHLLQRPCQPMVAFHLDDIDTSGNSEDADPQKDGELVPYWQQGNLQQYSMEAMLRRQKIRKATIVQHWLDAWWRAARSRIAKHTIGVSRQTCVRIACCPKFLQSLFIDVPVANRLGEKASLFSLTFCLLIRAMLELTYVFWPRATRTVHVSALAKGVLLK